MAVSPILRIQASCSIPNITPVKASKGQVSPFFERSFAEPLDDGLNWLLSSIAFQWNHTDLSKQIQRDVAKHVKKPVHYIQLTQIITFFLLKNEKYEKTRLEQKARIEMEKIVAMDGKETQKTIINTKTMDSFLTDNENDFTEGELLKNKDSDAYLTETLTSGSCVGLTY